MVRIFLLGPNRWPRDTQDHDAGLKIRRSLVADNQDLAAEWVLMEDDQTPGQPTPKFLAIAKHCTHVFLIWPRDCKMASTEDELVIWQTMKTLGAAPECYVFHQTGVLEIVLQNGEKQVNVLDEQGKSTYLRDVVRIAFEQEWIDLEDLRRQLREVLKGDLGILPRAGVSDVSITIKDKAGTRKTKLD